VARWGTARSGSPWAIRASSDAEIAATTRAGAAVRSGSGASTRAGVARSGLLSCRRETARSHRGLPVAGLPAGARRRRDIDRVARKPQLEPAHAAGGLGGRDAPIVKRIEDRIGSFQQIVDREPDRLDLAQIALDRCPPSTLRAGRRPGLASASAERDRTQTTHGQRAGAASHAHGALCRMSTGGLSSRSRHRSRILRSCLCSALLSLACCLCLPRGRC
jgi:hypothetical protein